MGVAIHAPVSTGHGRAPSSTQVTAVGIAIAAVVGAVVALAAVEFTGNDLSHIGPFSAPTEMCRFSTFDTEGFMTVSAPQQAVPGPVTRCNYLFEDLPYVQVGYRI